MRELLEEMVNNSCLLPAEHKAASSILCVLIKDAEVALKTKVNLEILLATPDVRSLLMRYIVSSVCQRRGGFRHVACLACLAEQGPCKRGPTGQTM